MGGFVVYQALPDDWAPGRNDELIFNKISYAFLFNMITQVIWFPTFQSYTGWGYVVSSIDIVFMTASAAYMMFVSVREQVNGWEMAFIRGGLTIYTGWLTSATILNFTAMLKDTFGFSEFEWYSEENITITILYVAFFIYELASYTELNPLYGAVYIWVAVAVRDNIIKEIP
jgi:hypothetical protein